MLIVPGHRRGRRETRRPVASVGKTDGLPGVFVAIHEVGAGTTVHVKVDEAGNEVAAAQIDLLYRLRKHRKRRRREYARFDRASPGRRRPLERSDP